MIEKFLRAKHWQIFIITFVIPFAVQLLFSFSMIWGILNTDGQQLEVISQYMIVIPFIAMFFTVIIYFWFWSLAIGLQKYIPEDLRLNTRNFKICFAFIFIFLLAIVCWFVYFFNTLNDLSRLEPDPSNFMVGIGLIFVVQIVVMVAVFYTYYFVAKTLNIAEKQLVSRSDQMIGDFFLLWFYPIGLWFIQPRVNKIVEERDNIIENNA